MIRGLYEAHLPVSNDGNLLELIAPVKLDVQEYFETIELDKWIRMSNKVEN